jgi:putative DNA primase/helicase
MRAQVRAFLAAHGESRFAPWDATEEQHVPNRAGYRKRGPDGDTFFVEREVFRNEICAGFDYREVARVLAEVGALESESHGDTTRMERLPDGRKTRVYRITPALWATT